MTQTLQLQLEKKLDSFTLSIKEQLILDGFAFVFGSSGAGKTTLLRSIAGLEKLPHSKIIFDDEVWQNKQNFVPTHQRAVGYVFQEPSLFPHLNVKDNIQYGFKRSRDPNKIHLNEVIEWFDLAPLLDRYADQLSQGQKQRVAIARAVVSYPKLLLMDEPLASLDDSAKHDIMICLENLQSNLNIPIIYVSHAMEEVMSLASQLILIEQGNIRAHGPVNRLMTDPNLPLAMRDDAAAILQGKVTGHDEKYALTHVAIPGGELSVSHRDVLQGKAIKVKLAARDVSLAADPPNESSITNALAARVKNISPSPDLSQLVVQLQLDDTEQCILARITKRSCDHLQLCEGKQIYALIKSASLLR